MAGMGEGKSVTGGKLPVTPCVHWASFGGEAHPPAYPIRGRFSEAVKAKRGWQMSRT